MNEKTLIAKIKEKKELEGIPDSFIAPYVQKRMSNSLSPKQAKILVKEVRAELRKHVGRFRSGELHMSALERTDNYDTLKRLIQEINPSSILDLGCGRNPLFLAESKYAYYACDIDGKSIEEVKEFFHKNGISGKAWVEDIRTATSFPTSDLCLLLKVVDLMDNKGHKNAESLIRKINTQQFIISFSTKTLSGRPMNHPQRGWIERLLHRLGFNYNLVKTENELFYITQK